MYDVIVVGNGGAGLTAAITLKKRGFNVVVLSKTSATSSQTCQAQGGINAVLDDNDNISNHVNDTFKSSNGIGNIKNIEFMCNNAKDSISWLNDLGVPFTRDGDKLSQRQMGGASHKRACYSSDYTGLKILHTLFDTALKLDIEFINDSMLLNLIVDDGVCKGITYLEIKTSLVNQLLACNVILATGGYSGVYYNHNTNSSQTTSDGIVAAYNAGCVLENMEFVQFHPTSLLDKYILISESARGEGGYLVTKDGKRFVDELLPRDIIAREIYNKISQDIEVFLDLRHLGLDKIMHLMPQEYKLCLDFKSLHMDKDLIPIIPASHYSMGGIKVNKESKTSLNNLYALGETSCNGVHGANRLGGNSLLDIITFSRYCANAIPHEHFDINNKIYNQTSKDEKIIDDLFSSSCESNLYKEREKFGSLMFHKVGLFRDNKNLNLALDYINKLKVIDFAFVDKSKIYNTNLKDILEFKNMILTAELIIRSALYRKESRGAHYRNDFIDKDINFSASTISYKNQSVVFIGADNDNNY